MNQHQTANRNTQNIPGTRKVNDEYNGSYQSYTSRTPMIITTSTTSRNTVSDVFTQRPNKNTETPEHKTLNNALVPTNEV